MRIPPLKAVAVGSEYVSLLFPADDFDKGDHYFDEHDSKNNINCKTAARPAPSSTMAATTTPDSKRTFTTQQTFDSTDELLDHEDGDDSDDNINVVVATDNGKEEEGGQQPPRRSHKDKSLWDCKAVRFPPHHPITVVKAAWNYVQNPYLILEVLVLTAFLGVCYFSPDYLVEAHHRPIPFQTTDAGDTLIDLTFANLYHHKETIPGHLLNLLTVVLPMSIFWTMGACLGPRGDMHGIVCTFVLTMALKIFVVACIKNYAGYLRPSFYDMCQFNAETLVCDDETTSARESFPSGHAATALSSMTLLALYLLGKVRGGTRQRGVSEAVIKDDNDVDDIIWAPSLLEKPLSVLAIAPICLGMFIATSRVKDNWHHPADVVCGGIIGVGSALFAHGLWFPSVYSHYAGIPLTTVKAILVERKARAKAAVLFPRLDLAAIDQEV